MNHHGAVSAAHLEKCSLALSHLLRDLQLVLLSPLRAGSSYLWPPKRRWIMMIMFALEISSNLSRHPLKGIPGTSITHTSDSIWGWIGDPRPPKKKRWMRTDSAQSETKHVKVTRKIETYQKIEKKTCRRVFR